MSQNLENALRLSLPISHMGIRYELNGSEVLPIIFQDTNGAAFENARTSVRALGLYITSMIGSDPAFMLPISSITGLSNILNQLAQAAHDLEDRVAANEGDIVNINDNLSILNSGWVLLQDNWPV